MENNQLPSFSVSDFVASFNQTLEYAYPSVIVEGEVESFKINQGKFVFFNLKDSGASIGCFMMQFQLRVPLEDGMKIVVRAKPKLTAFGKFSLTIETIRPVGEGSIRRGFELLQKKLTAEGLFAQERKRPLPVLPTQVAVIASTESAGYADFMKIVDQRWGGVTFAVYHTQVQGLDAPSQITSAIEYFNQREQLPEVLVIIRGGGSADDLAAFNDEVLVRAVASSRIPTLVGVGHEVDTTLCDFAADVRAATPSNAAQILVPNRKEMTERVGYLAEQLRPRIRQIFDQRIEHVAGLIDHARDTLDDQLEATSLRLESVLRLLESYNPEQILKRGYAIVRGTPDIGSILEIETVTHKLQAEVKKNERK